MNDFKDGLLGFAKDEAINFGKNQLKAGLNHAYEYAKGQYHSVADYYKSISAAKEKQRNFAETVKRAQPGSHFHRGPQGIGSRALAVIREHQSKQAGHSDFSAHPGHEEPSERHKYLERRRHHKGPRSKGAMPHVLRRRIMRHANRGHTRRTGGRSLRAGTGYVKGRFRGGSKRGTGGYIGRKSRLRGSTALVASSSAYRTKASGSGLTSFSRAVAANNLADRIAPAIGDGTSSNKASVATQYWHSDAAVAIKRDYGTCGTFFFPGTATDGTALANDFTRDQTNILSIYSPNDIRTVNAATAITGTVLYTKHAKTTITLTNMDVLACSCSLSFWESRANTVPSVNILSASNGAGGAMSNTSPSPLAFLQYGMYITGQSAINTSDGIDRRSFNETDSPTFCSMFHRYHTEEFMMMPGVDYTFHIEEHKTRSWDFSKTGNDGVETNFATMKGQKFMTGRFHGGTVVDNTGVTAYGVVAHTATVQGGANNIDQGQIRIAGIVNKSMEFYQADDSQPTSTYQAGSFTAITVPTGISLAGGGIVADAGAGG